MGTILKHKTIHEKVPVGIVAKGEIEEIKKSEKKSYKTPMVDKRMINSFGGLLEQVEKVEEESNSDEDDEFEFQIAMSEDHHDYKTGLAAVERDNKSFVERMSSKYGLSPVN